MGTGILTVCLVVRLHKSRALTWGLWGLNITLLWFLTRIIHHYCVINNYVSRYFRNVVVLFVVYHTCLLSSISIVFCFITFLLYHGMNLTVETIPFRKLNSNTTRRRVLWKFYLSGSKSLLNSYGASWFCLNFFGCLCWKISYGIS